MEKIFTEADYINIKKKGIDLETIKIQLDYFVSGISKINLIRPATINDGIWVISDEEKTFYLAYFDEIKDSKDIQKFVPASGAASRMFKFLSEFLHYFDFKNETINAYINRTKTLELSIFLAGIRDFPFYEKLKEKTILLYSDYYEKERDIRAYYLIQTLLSDSEFNFANKPKGILPFHKKQNKILTPIEEHLNESVFYCGPNKKSKVHFTISKEFQNDFENITSAFNHIDVSYSYQHEFTDTIAVNPDNTPFRENNNELLFRPGGHGALIENLNHLDADLIFIKNIDNVSQNHITEIINYKKILGGVLFSIQKTLFSYLHELETGNISEEKLNEIIAFSKNKLNIPLANDFHKYKKTYQMSVLFSELNRPIRVCGMVINEGEPGGGPFWVQNSDGKVSLQIVETAQIDLKNKIQQAIVNQSTHFNPVDLVCGIKNYKGEKFDLTLFIDKKMGFIVEKNKDGKPLKSYELPGLWNGGMANWISLFVEVPLTTFNPVKTVNDLLKSSHQPDNG